jgi:hypothetical protein
VYAGRSVFSQLFDAVSPYEFNKCVRRYEGDRQFPALSCIEQFRVLAFAQLMGKESLRDIETCLRALGSKLYHSGFRSSTARSTLADANESRDWRIFADFAAVLIKEAVALYADEELGVQLRQAVYALDSSTIHLCLALVPWARLRDGQAAIKLHTQLALRGNIPTVVLLTPATTADVTFLDAVIFDPGAFYIFDRGYLHFARLHRIHEAQAFFVTRAKKNFRFCRRYSSPVDKAAGVRCDQTVVLDDFKTKPTYPDALRRIVYRDEDSGRRFVFLTNNVHLPAVDIARLYKSRWQIELFFKWIKQHLCIRSFYGTTENAVKIQVWVAISVYVLAALLKKRLGLAHSLYTILQILSVTLFENQPISQAFAHHLSPTEPDPLQNQLCFQGFSAGQ